MKLFSDSQLTVIIPTVGRIEMLRACLDSIQQNTFVPGEVFIADQSDSDQVSELVRFFPKLNIRVEKCSGTGIARNMNFAIRHAYYNRVLVTHDDCVVAKDWVEKGSELLRMHPNDIVSGMVLPGGDGSMQVPSTKTQTTKEIVSDPHLFGCLYPNNMGFTKDRIFRAGIFDERKGFTRAAEDLDFSYRWLKSGYLVRYEPQFIVTHNDWRGDAELSSLYRLYARCAGRFYGKLLFDGDTAALVFARKDLKQGIKAFLRNRHLPPSERDIEKQFLAMWMPIGIIEGLFESLLTRLKK